VDHKPKNDRGFIGSTFVDRYGSTCSIQESSASGDEDTGAFIWFGVDRPAVKVMSPETGWTDVPLPTDVLIAGRMHLSQVQVAELLPSLMYFAETGGLPNAEQHKQFTDHLDAEGVQESINSFFEAVSS
jgi:hypothetical protein